MKLFLRLSLLLSLSLLFGCASTPHQPSEAFLKANPHSILVLPPTNKSPEVLAPYMYLSTMNKALGERGYYVFPVMLVDQFMKDNGYYIPEEMHQIPIDKLYDVFGQDAVLYITISRFGQEFFLFSSSTVVQAQARLVDSKTGTTLWEGKAFHSESTNNGSTSSFTQMMVNAVMDQIVDNLSVRVRHVSYIANDQMINNPSGFPKGPYRIARELEEAKNK